MRSYNRFETDREIACTISGGRDFVQLYNLSCGGCMIETGHPDAAVNAIVQVHLNDMTVMPGRIVWRCGRNAGVKFEVPLHSRLVESLGYMPGEEFDASDPRDRFGIPLETNSWASDAIVDGARLG
ncbi:PilZ domain-containing protein [Paraurantiacibacter namhicola]|uniref:PilZ domain protein n=1 Tax=Paraurantiacibacter namhicola TaxID=645517 RepID=A0A1C7D9Y3_9SPHN|nr:PilZ domain-containing protein [Paraurantiacibacter namhicola]ANU08237.1 PilZ domain protein [Paraurantiacibacter namhicola]